MARYRLYGGSIAGAVWVAFASSLRGYREKEMLRLHCRVCGAWEDGLCVFLKAIDKLTSASPRLTMFEYCFKCRKQTSLIILHPPGVVVIDQEEKA